jgi:hypothetical protein
MPAGTLTMLTMLTMLTIKYDVSRRAAMDQTRVRTTRRRGLETVGAGW